jgi:hypothetical protein
VRRFVNAFHGLAPWNPCKDPAYFDKLLVDPSMKPVNRLVYKA